MGRVVRLAPEGEPATLGAAAEAFLAGRELAPGSRRVYGLTMARLRAELGDDAELARLTPTRLRRALAAAYPEASAATWNRVVATTRSFLAWCARQGWVAADPAASLERRRAPADHARSIPYAELEKLWRRDDVALREKALWRLLYETAARAQEVLALDVEDVDLPNKRARITSKGGDADVVHFMAGSARLLPRLVAGRRRGPLFLASLAPSPSRAPAAVDLCPETGRARLSYRRAAELFSAHSGGWTLHQLRHSALTHLAEANTSLPLLMAKSRHQNLRSLQRYARPPPEAVSKLTSAHYPARPRGRR